MASINCEGGIQNSICLPSNTMETQIIKYKPSRSASSKRSSQQIPFSRNSRNYANTIRKISFKVFHDTRKHQETANSGLSKIESTHPVRTFQDGRSTGVKRVNRKGRFHVQDRLERCLHRSSNSSRISTISHIQKRRENLSISFPRIWTKCGSQAVLKTNEIRNRTITLPRNPLGILSRRHLSTFKVKRRSIKNNPTGNKTSKIFGIHYQRRKEHTYTLSNTGIPGISKKMKITVPSAKINNLLQRIKQASQPIKRSCRWIAALLGKVTSMIPAISEALLHIRHIQRDLAKSLHLNNQNWEKPCQISQQGQQEFQWWKKSITTKNGLPIQSMEVPTPQITIYTGSSDSGWGVSSPMSKTFGFWNKEEQGTSINVRELKPVYFALKMHAKKLENCTIKVFTNNTTALKYTTKFGEQLHFNYRN
jgi:hypothetical protein